MRNLRKILLYVLPCICFTASAQNTFKAIVKADGEDADTLAGALALVVGTEISGLADSNGLVILSNIPNGDQQIEVSFIGYFKKRVKVKFPRPDSIVEITLENQAQQVEEVVVTSTRNYQKSEYLPTQVDVVNEEEVEEESHDKPSDVSHVVHEQTGVQVQRTSAIAGTLGIRLQGLGSSYVQILKDGFPLFGGFSNVIGITQIPPLDLRQVEIIKGPSSTLYGGDAIAGVINLISKEPSEKPVYDLMFNGESSKAFDGGLYASQKIKWFGFSLTGAYRYQYEKDWSGYGFTETPFLKRLTINPQLFFDLSKHAKLNIGVNYTNEYRVGGSTSYFAGNTDSTNNYYEKNTSDHIASNMRFTYDFEKKGLLTVKNSVNYFKRSLSLPFYQFNGVQLASASEINYHFNFKKHDLVVGLDFRSDRFTEGKDSSAIARNYYFLTGGFFGQYLYHFNERTTAELGLRLDYNNVYGIYALPHVALLQRWNKIFSTRLNIGMGYKLPTIFQETSEEARFINVTPIADSIKPEISLGGTIDLRVKLPNFNGVNITIHQLYFLTHIFRPVLSDTLPIANCPTHDCQTVNYFNAPGFIESGGVETGFNLTYRGFNAYVTYTYTDNHRKIGGVREISPLTSKHIVSMLYGYEIKHFFVGLDCYYYSPVKLTDGSVGQRIWEVGISAQYAFKYLLLFANFENIADIRQTSYGPVVFPSPTFAHPAFKEIYAPLEGRLFNVGFKLHLGAFGKKKTATNGIERLGTKDSD